MGLIVSVSIFCLNKLFEVYLCVPKNFLSHYILKKGIFLIL